MTGILYILHYITAEKKSQTCVPDNTADNNYW